MFMFPYSCSISLKNYLYAKHNGSVSLKLYYEIYDLLPIHLRLVFLCALFPKVLGTTISLTYNEKKQIVFNNSK
jgi:hypothetical protein